MATIHRHAKPHVRLMMLFFGKPAHERARLVNEARKQARLHALELKNAVAARDGRKCKVCGSTRQLELDHILPVSKGGKTEVKNLQLLCHEHNREKANRWEDTK